MDTILQKYDTKRMYRVPEGLRELCTDIAREVLRTQPSDIYLFIADYVDALFITRENAKVAVKVVNNILSGSEAIMSILQRTGLSFQQITVAAPRLQKVFRDYVDALDPQSSTSDRSCDQKSRLSLQNVLEATGVTLGQAERAAKIIQNAFRNHYESIIREGSKGLIQCQRALANTMKILMKAGVSQAEATRAVTLIQAAYRGYYTRRNTKLKTRYEEVDYEQDHNLDLEVTIQAVAWFDIISKDSKITLKKADQAATVIQNAYKKYRQKKYSYKIERVESTRSMVAGAIIDTLRKRVFDRVVSREDIPAQKCEEITKAGEKLEQLYKSHLRHSLLFAEDVKEDEEFKEKKETKHHPSEEEIQLVKDEESPEEDSPLE